MNGRYLLASGTIGFQAWLLFMAGRWVEPLLVLASIIVAFAPRPLKLHSSSCQFASAALGIGILASWWFQLLHAGENNGERLTWTLPAAAWLLTMQALELLKPMRGPQLPRKVTAF